MKYLGHFFPKKVAAPQSLGWNFTESNVFDQKYVELTFHFKSNLYCVKDNVYVWLPTVIPKPLLKLPNGPPNVFLFPTIAVLRIWKKQQQIAEKQSKILEKYLWRNPFLTFTGIFLRISPGFKIPLWLLLAALIFRGGYSFWKRLSKKCFTCHVPEEVGSKENVQLFNV